MRNEIKISFIDQRFYVDQKRNEVHCVLNFKPLYPSFIQSILTQLGWYTPNWTVRSSAYLKEQDSFDIVKGQKVALAKAENKAYCKVGRILKLVQEYIKLSDWQISSFCDKVDNVNNHNLEYINKF
jgi:hypothetical protein